jgi:hypothetical protein
MSGAPMILATLRRAQRSRVVRPDEDLMTIEIGETVKGDLTRKSTRA